MTRTQKFLRLLVTALIAALEYDDSVRPGRGGLFARLFK